jgi:hypothetical protein
VVFLRGDAEDPALHERQRDIFPLPLVDAAVAAELQFSYDGVADDDLPDLVVRVANLSLQALNVLSGFKAPVAQTGRCAPQRAVQFRVFTKAGKFVKTLHVCEPPAPTVGLGRLIHNEDLSGVKSAAPKLDADRCDLLEHSGGVDPLPYADPAGRLTLNSADALFQEANLDWVRAARIGLGDRSEYARLVVRQLRSRKVCLRQSVRSSASIFAVGKSSGGLREVWNGHDLSTLAAIPPKPPHLAGVTALVDLEASDEVPIVAFKRDARCFFDQLSLSRNTCEVILVGRGCALRTSFATPTWASVNLSTTSGLVLFLILTSLSTLVVQHGPWDFHGAATWHSRHFSLLCPEQVSRLAACWPTTCRHPRSLTCACHSPRMTLCSSRRGSTQRPAQQCVASTKKSAGSES